MAYLALYREWRPQRFDEVVGQDHVKRTLQNALANGRIAHAYLFTGPRGTGKTTVAKLLAKAVNCHDQSSVEPCNECSACVSITEGSSMDVLEIDAASNRGIDEIRELRERVRYAPAENRYKVYIVDEVHMLTGEASNALLKTLEEPPSHVIFVLATTEPHKLLPTIISRCQRFDFHLLPTDLIAGRLREVCEARGAAVSDEALMLIARHAEGGMRDGLSLLDQVLSFGEDGLTIDDVLSVLGTAQDDTFFEFVDAVCAGSVQAVLELVDQVVLRGIDIRQFVKDFIGHLRNLLMVLVAGDPAQLVPVGPTGIEKLEKQAHSLGRETIMELIDAFTELDGRLRWSSQPRLVAEVELLRLMRQTRDKAGNEPEHNEPEPEPELVPEPVQENSVQSEPTEAEEPTPAPESGKPEKSTRFESTSLDELWQRVRDGVKKQSKKAEAWLIPATPLGVDDGTLTISFPADYGLHRDNVRGEFNELVSGVVADVFGTPLELNLILKGEEPGERRGSSQTANRKPAARGRTVDSGDGNGGPSPASSKPGEKRLSVDPATLDPLVRRAMDIFDGELVEVRDDASEQAAQQEED